MTLHGRRPVMFGMGAAMVAAALDGCAGARPGGPAKPTLVLPRLRADPALITRITVCSRPFRPTGPRIELEQMGSKAVVHNYGHGGSGWSLSWGSSALAADLAMRTGERDLAVIGCGALGLTSAILLQRAGARVTIYAKDLPPNVRSSLASGIWSPSSRICFEEHATPGFKQRWELMARTSFDAYQSWLGLPGQPIQFFDAYALWDADEKRREGPADARPRFAELEHDLLRDLNPKADRYEPGTHSLGPRQLRRGRSMMININAYQRMLLADFYAGGGQLEVRDFHSPADFQALRQKTLINATGYGAKALIGDQSLVPVRGQIARTPPQPGIEYGLYYRGVSFVPRPDGFVFQHVGHSDYEGFGDETTTPSRPEAEAAVKTIAGLFDAG